MDIEAKTETSKPKSSDFQVKITESNSSNLQLKATENKNLLPSNNITATVASITEECMMNTTVALPNPDLSDQQKTDVASLSTLTASPNKDCMFVFHFINETIVYYFFFFIQCHYIDKDLF